MIKVFRDLNEWLKFRDSGFAGKTLGFVPTMGALHDGHRSLVERSVRENDLTLVSVYVNPTQFDDKNDFEKYPSTLREDVELLEKAGADFVLSPTFEMMYPDKFRYQISEHEISKVLCGAHRPGHFQGVLTIVMKLLNIARADRAYFGEKDYQQYELVKGMCEAFFMKTEIVGCPIVREADGLAMSSRNRRLNPFDRERAANFPRVLRSASDDEGAVNQLKNLGFDVDYVVTQGGRRFGAVKVGDVRLIDNVSLL